MNLLRVQRVLGVATILVALLGFYLTYTQSRASTLAVGACLTLSASTNLARAARDKAGSYLAFFFVLLAIGIFSVALAVYWKLY